MLLHQSSITAASSSTIQTAFVLVWLSSFAVQTAVFSVFGGPSAQVLRRLTQAVLTEIRCPWLGLSVGVHSLFASSVPSSSPPLRWRQRGRRRSREHTWPRRSTVHTKSVQCRSSGPPPNPPNRIQDQTGRAARRPMRSLWLPQRLRWNTTAVKKCKVLFMGNADF